MKADQQIKQFITSDFAKNSAKLLSANVIAQIIGLLIYPVLTRLYSPDDFGLLNLFLSIGGVIVLFATAEYQYAIMLPKSDEKAAACFHIGFFITLTVTAICLFSVLFSQQIANLFNTPNLAQWYCLLPLYVFVSASWILLNYWYTRHKKFGNISTYQMTQSVFSAGTKWGFGACGFTAGGMIVSIVVAPFISLIISISAAFKTTIRPLFKIKRSLCKDAAKEYANFPKFSLPRAAVNNFSGNLPILLLTPFFGLSDIGFFGMALTLAFRPINMISGSLYQVFFQKTAEKVQNRQSILPFFRKFIFNALLIIIPCFTGLYFILPQLTEWLLGSEWRIAGEYIRFMLPWLLISFVVAPICFLSDIFQKQKLGLIFEILLITARIIGLLMGVYYHNFILAIVGYCIGSTIIIFVQLIWYMSLVMKYELSTKS